MNYKTPYKWANSNQEWRTMRELEPHQVNYVPKEKRVSLKTVCRPPDGRATTIWLGKIDDRRYGIDSPDYSFVQKYSIGEFVIPLVSMSFDPKGLSWRDSEEISDRMLSRVGYVFPKIDTKPKTLQKFVTFGLFVYGSSIKRDYFGLMHFADVDLPKEIQGETDSPYDKLQFASVEIDRSESGGLVATYEGNGNIVVRSFKV